VELFAKKVKTWTHLPEKPLSKIKGTRGACEPPQNGPRCSA